MCLLHFMSTKPKTKANVTFQSRVLKLVRPTLPQAPLVKHTCTYLKGCDSLCVKGRTQMPCNSWGLWFRYRGLGWYDNIPPKHDWRNVPITVEDGKVGHRVTSLTVNYTVKQGGSIIYGFFLAFLCLYQKGELDMESKVNRETKIAHVIGYLIPIPYVCLVFDVAFELFLESENVLKDLTPQASCPLKSAGPCLGHSHSQMWHNFKSIPHWVGW